MKVKPLIIYLLLFCSCRSKADVSPDDRLSQYAVPVTKPFHLPEAKPIKWKVYPTDSLPKETTVRFDIDKLPSKPFSAHGFTPLKKPPQSISFDWNKLKTVSINIDTITYEPVKYRRFRLPQPVVSIASMPAITNKGTAGVTRLGPSEGLAGGKVHAVIEDRDGSAWLSTERGLSRYTGTEFLTYNFFDKDASGAVEVLGDMLIDSSGRLIVSALTSGLYRIDTRLGIVEHFEQRPGLNRISFDNRGRFWGSKDGQVQLYQLDFDNRRIGKLSFWGKEAQPQNLYGVHTDRAGNLWLGFRRDLCIIDPGFTTMRVFTKTDGLPVEMVFDFDEDRSGRVWLTSYLSPMACAISLDEQKITLLGPEQDVHGIPYGIFIDRYNRAWLTTNDTVYVYDQEKASLKKMETNAPLVAGNYPASGMQSRDGMIWMGTNADGVILMDPDGMMADHFNERDGIESNDVWGVSEDSKGRIWLATYKGLNIYDPKTERLSLLKFPTEISRNEHRQIRKIGPDIFLLGTVGGFGIMDVQAGSFTFYNTVWNKSSAVSFTGIMDQQGAIWVSGGDGLIYYDRTKKIFKRLDESGGLFSNLAFVTAQDKSGRIWICTEKAVTLIFPGQDSLVNLTEENGLSGSYSSMFVESQPSGNLLLGSDKGYSIIDKDLKTIKNIGAVNGLLPASMYDMTECNNRLHIGSENGIIVVDQPDDTTKPWRFFRYNKSAGFPYNDYNQSTAFVSSKGDVWWGAAPILTVVHQQPITDSIPPVVQIQGMTIMDQHESFVNDSGYYFKNNIRWDSVRSSFQLPAGLKLPYDQNSFSFSFANQSARSRDRIVYRFYLEGEDESWSDISEKPVSRVYYNIAPGHYRFKVITRGYNSMWSEPTVLEFTILPPWWQTWWAYVLFALLGATIIYLIVLFRSKMLQKENRLLEKKVQMRTEALHQKMEELKAAQNQLVQSEKMASLGELTAGIAHEIQNPLNFINNFSEINKELLLELYEELKKGDMKAIGEIAEDIQANEEKIYHHGRRADGIVKSMLQHSRSNSNLTKEPTDINKLADEYLRLAYHGLRAKDKSFNAGMKTEFDESIPPVNMVSQDIGRVILNLLTNAFYAVNERAKAEGQSFKPMVSVRTKKINDKVELVVIDNGNGIPQNIIDKIYQPFFTTKPTGQGTGLGLSMSYDIVTKAHGGELKVITQEGEGTQFKIVLPIKNV